MEKKNTLKDDAKGAFADLLPDTKVVADDAGGCSLRGRGRGYYMWSCHHELERDGRGKGVTKVGTGKRGKGWERERESYAATGMRNLPNSAPSSHAFNCPFPLHRCQPFRPRHRNT